MFKDAFLNISSFICSRMAEDGASLSFSILLQDANEGPRLGSSIKAVCFLCAGGTILTSLNIAVNPELTLTYATQNKFIELKELVTEYIINIQEIKLVYV